MYFNKVNNACLYSTLIRHTYFISFFSIYDINLSKRNSKFEYICDKEFLIKYLKSNLDYNEGRNLYICIDEQDDKFKSLLKLYNYDFLLTFKCYLNDFKLDRLYKVG